MKHSRVSGFGYVHVGMVFHRYQMEIPVFLFVLSCYNKTAPQVQTSALGSQLVNLGPRIWLGVVMGRGRYVCECVLGEAVHSLLHGYMGTNISQWKVRISLIEKFIKQLFVSSIHNILGLKSLQLWWLNFLFKLLLPRSCAAQVSGKGQTFSLV